VMACHQARRAMADAGAVLDREAEAGRQDPRIRHFARHQLKPNRGQAAHPHDLRRRRRGRAVLSLHRTGRARNPARVPDEGLRAMAASAGHCTQHRGRVASDHTKSIVHRDIKSENVICAGDGAVKILDFGVAKFVSPPDAGAMTGPGSCVVDRLTGDSGEPNFRQLEPNWRIVQKARGAPKGSLNGLWRLAAAKPSPFPTRAAIASCASICRPSHP
jgi:hypothetical protein